MRRHLHVEDGHAGRQRDDGVSDRVVVCRSRHRRLWRLGRWLGTPGDAQAAAQPGTALARLSLGRVQGQHRPLRGPIRIGLDRVVSVRAVLEGRLCLVPAALLHDVGKLVGQERVAGRCAGPVASVGESHVLAQGEGARVQVAGQRRCLAVIVDAHVREVVAEGRLHPRACRPIERMARSQARRERLSINARPRAAGCLLEEQAADRRHGAADRAHHRRRGAGQRPGHSPAREARAQLVRDVVRDPTRVHPPVDALGHALADERDVVTRGAHPGRWRHELANGALQVSCGPPGIVAQPLLDVWTAPRVAAGAAERLVCGGAHRLAKLRQELALSHLARGQGLCLIVDDEPAAAVGLVGIGAGALEAWADRRHLEGFVLQRRRRHPIGLDLERVGGSQSPCRRERRQAGELEAIRGRGARDRRVSVRQSWAGALGRRLFRALMGPRAAGPPGGRR